MSLLSQSSFSYFASLWSAVLCGLSVTGSNLEAKPIFGQESSACWPVGRNSSTQRGDNDYTFRLLSVDSSSMPSSDSVDLLKPAASGSPLTNSLSSGFGSGHLRPRKPNLRKHL